MKKKFLPLILATLSLFTLSGCSLFDDSDLAIHNEYNPITDNTEEDDPNAVYAGGVKAKDNENVPNAYCFKNIGYSTNETIINTYKEGGVNHTLYNVNNGKDYFANKSNNNFDLYVPKNLDKNEKHVVILFIHGGAWVSGFKTDVNSYVHEFANKGYITATIKYTLLKRSMDDSSLSIFRDLDEIDACVSMIKSCLEELKFDTTKTNLVVGGASSGAHLAMLYSYSRGNNAPLPIKFIVDAVGPVNIKPDSWKRFSEINDEILSSGLSYSAIEKQKVAGNLTELAIAGDTHNWTQYQTMRIANGMCGLPYTLDEVRASTTDEIYITNPTEASNSMTQVGGGEDLLSVTHYISASNNIPIICAYAGRDSIVGIAQFAKLEQSLIANGVEYEYFYFKDSDHTEITEEKNPTQYNAFIEKIDEWCKNL